MNSKIKRTHRHYRLIAEDIENLRKKRLEDGIVSSPYDEEIKNLQQEYLEAHGEEYRIPSLFLDIIKIAQNAVFLKRNFDGEIEMIECPLPVIAEATKKYLVGQKKRNNKKKK